LVRKPPQRGIKKKYIKKKMKKMKKSAIKYCRPEILLENVYN
jgi:hypothetical protein